MRSLRPHLPFLLATALQVIILLFLFLAGPISWSDSGGYENIFQHFLGTGKIDDMFWCMPSLIATFPLAAVAIKLFGNSSLTLQATGIIYAVVCATGLYLFAIRYTSRWLATLISLTPLCCGEYLLNAPTFMSDVPYIAFLLWVLVVGDRLEARYQVAARQGDSPVTLMIRHGGLWIAWAVLLLSATLCRTFTIALLPLFLLRYGFLLWRKRDDIGGRLYVATAAGITCVTLGIAVLILRHFTINPYPADQVTLIPALLRHEWGKVYIKAGGLFLANSLAAALPVLIWCYRLPVSRRSVVFAALASLGMFLVALIGWHRGRFYGTFTCTELPEALPGCIWIGLVQTLLVLPAVFIFCKVLGAVLYREGTEQVTSTTPGLLVGLIAAHYLATLIMPIPFLRHFIPVYFCVVLLAVIVCGRTIPGNPWIGGSAFALFALLIGFNVAAVYSARRINVEERRLALELKRRGIADADMDAGFSWFLAVRYKPSGLDYPGYQDLFLIREKAPVKLVQSTPGILPVGATGCTGLDPRFVDLNRTMSLPVGTVRLQFLACGDAGRVR